VRCSDRAARLRALRGIDGAEIIELVREINIPCIVIAHTVLAEPNENQKKILEFLVEVSECTVVMSEVAKHRMCRHFDVTPTKIQVIPHGCDAFVSKPIAPSTDRPLLLSWVILVAVRGSNGQLTRSRV